MNNNIKPVIVGLLIGTSAIGIISGIESTYDQNNHYTGGCKYESIISVIDPGYILTCELLRKRFSIP